VGTEEVILGSVLVIGLVAISLFYAWRQLKYWKPSASLADAEEGRYRYKQSRRRLLGSALMLVLAGQLAWDMLFLRQRAHEQGERAEARAEARERGEPGQQPTLEERSFARFYSAFWIVFLLVLLGIVTLAVVDFWATRIFAVRAHRQLRADRREMIDRQIARLRQEKGERNGHS
jgi:hypothetical protein